jgi:hypothetical protein
MALVLLLPLLLMRDARMFVLSLSVTAANPFRLSHGAFLWLFAFFL